jgi:hypothetical protein
MGGLVQLHGKTLPAEVRGTFLERLAETGNVMRVCAELGLTRQAVYYWRATDEDFWRAWQWALDIFNEQLTSEVIDTARALGTGRWVPLLDDAGQPVLDDNFERVMVFETARVDARILAKLIDKRVRSVDGPAQTNVQVNAMIDATPRPSPRLIRPRLDDAVDLGGAEFTETAEAVLGSPYEPLGRDEDEGEDA